MTHVKEEHFAFVRVRYDLLKGPGDANPLLLPLSQPHVPGQLGGNVSHKVDLVPACIPSFTCPVAVLIFLQKETTDDVKGQLVFFVLYPSFKDPTNRFPDAACIVQLYINFKDRI